VIHRSEYPTAFVSAFDDALQKGLFWGLATQKKGPRGPESDPEERIASCIAREKTPALVMHLAMHSGELVFDS